MPSKKARKTLFGALSLTSEKFYWKQAEVGNAHYFQQFLRQLHQAHPDKQLLIVLDNGPIHRAHAVKKFVAKQDWVTLYSLPSYSPEYNPIERFWKWLKKVIYGATSYPSVEAIIQTIRKLIWHYNEGRLVNAIQFNFGVYANLL